MSPNQIKISNLLRSINFEDYYKLKAATNDQIEFFKKIAFEKQVEQNVVAQLIELYQIVNNYNFEIIIAFHSCDDETIFEWWNDNELWLGQRDFYTLRWASGKFCLGDAGNISFSDEYKFETLIELIEACVKDINDSDYFNEGKPIPN